MPALTDAAARSAGGSSGEGTTSEVTQRLLPSTNGEIEMAAHVGGAFGGGNSLRRRAHVLERLQSLDPHNRGGIDKEQLVGAQPRSCHAAEQPAPTCSPDLLLALSRPFTRP